MRRLAAPLLAVLLALPLFPRPGGPLPPGADALRATRAWWQARQVEDASARQDVRALLDRSEAFGRLSGNPEPFLFALHRLGIDAPAPGRGLGPESSLAMAQEARRRLARSLYWLPDPANGVRLHEYLVARRLLPLGGSAVALEASRMPELLAGGGPGLEADPAAYQEWLRSAPAERKAAILERLRLLGL